MFLSDITEKGVRYIVCLQVTEVDRLQSAFGHQYQVTFLNTLYTPWADTAFFENGGVHN